MVEGTDTNDFKFSFAIPSGATGTMNVLGQAVASVSVNSASVKNVTVDMTSDTSVGTVGTQVVPVWVSGVLNISSTSGTAQLRWAQNTTEAANLILKAGSFIRFEQV